MPKICRGCWLSLVALFLCGTLAGRTQNPSPPVEARVVKYAGLVQEVLKHKGKVVVVDCWGITWLPCLQGFPHLVEMHRKYAGQGLVALSVHVDPPPDAEVKNQILKFLRARQATCTNLILDEPSEVWQDKLHAAFLPNVFVFNRAGQWTQFKTEDVKYEEIEKLVVHLLKK